MKYHLVALFTVFVWGTTFVSTKVLLADFSPLWVLLIRFIYPILVKPSPKQDMKRWQPQNEPINLPIVTGVSMTIGGLILSHKQPARAS